MICASCAIPGIFKPIYYDKKCLIDGGITNNFPIETAPKNTPIIGVHVNPLTIRKKYTFKDLSMISINVLLARGVKEKSKQCEIFIEPPKLADIDQSLFVNTQEIIDI